MMLTKYVGPMLRDSFDHQVDDLFDEAVRAVGGFMSPRHIPWNVYEKDDWLWIEAGVPGLTGKDVDVKVEDSILIMSIPHRPEDKGEGLTYFVRELGVGAVTRSMRLPAYVDVDKATATCKDGILSIGFPKRVEAMARQIPIEDKLEV